MSSTIQESDKPIKLTIKITGTITKYNTAYQVKL